MGAAISWPCRAGSAGAAPGASGGGVGAAGGGAALNRHRRARGVAADAHGLLAGGDLDLGEARLLEQLDEFF